MDTHELPPEARSDLETAAATMSSTVQILTLPVGLYAFTVQGGGQPRPAAGLALPALQVAAAPIESEGRLEFLSGPATLDRWLTTSGDVVTVKISGGEARLLLTSLRAPESGVLSIDVRQLDAPATATATASAPAGSSAATGAAGGDETRVITMVHVPYLGDLSFVEGWAGRPSENLWIEGFALLVQEPNEPKLLEYQGVTEEGLALPWMSAGEFCGARGTGVPLVEFAVRLHPDAAGRYVCRYSGQFLSGTIVGPLEGGLACRSDAAGDPLVAIQLELAPVAAAG
jgi:hypothetical protein